MVTFLVYLLGIGSMLVILFGTRLNNAIASSDLFIYPSEPASNAGVIAGRITTGVFLLICAGCVVYSLLLRRFRFPKQGALLTFTGCLVFLAPVVSSLVSENGGFDYKLLFFPLFLLTIYLLPRERLDGVIPRLVPLFAIFTIFSLASIFVAPSWAYSDYTNSWVGIPIRLQGLSSHPNSLGNLALVLLIMLRFLKKKGFWITFLTLCGLAVIILSQSKTIWITLLIWIILEWAVRRFSSLPQQSTRWLTGLMAILGLGLTFVVLLSRESIPGSTLTPLSLTGRVDVWQVTLDTWLENPLFGYGPNLWNLFFRQDYGFLWAGQAHNQYLQTLGESGLLGLSALLVYLFAIIRAGSRGLAATRFATFGILIALVVRSFVESPFRTYSLDEGFLIQAVFLMILIHVDQQPATPIHSVTPSPRTAANMMLANEELGGG